ncbi:MAG: glutaminase A [Vicinamibacterales bacterium]
MAEAPTEQHEMQAVVDAVYEKYRPLSDGEVATYIPELSKANPDDFGVSLVTADGRLFESGDCDRAFTIQSISKPFTFGMAIDALGHDKVLQHVGVEPSGDAFNSIELQNGSNRPFNPMVNAGAITVTALLHAKYGDQTLDMLIDRFSAFAGRPLAIDRDVYESERRTGHRNRAIAHLLLNFGIVHEQAEAALDLYFKQCSILVTCRDLAMMAATLSNMGCNPITGTSTLSVACVKDVLSVMFTCGMYDYSGQWAYRVGVPAKSGVGGGVVAVVNRQLGIGTYSPRLDRYGNSARGVEVCAELASRLGLHVFDCLNVGSGYLDTIL